MDSYYQERLGPRWQDLKQALLQETAKFPLSQGLNQTYFLDEASLWAAQSLPINAGDQVGDLCAAPGGKSLVLALALPPGAALTCNERSVERFRRLRAVLNTHLPANIGSHITLRKEDATSWGVRAQKIFHKILLDAPCSSEGHVLSSPKHLAQWSPARIKRLAVTQFAMLASALDLCIPGGEITYSTCALLPDENDHVIAKLFKKRKGRFEVLPAQASMGESTQFGWQIWPDVCQGRGPIYFARIRVLA